MKIHVKISSLLLMVLVTFPCLKIYAQAKYTVDEIDSLLKTKEFTDTCTYLDLSNIPFKEFPKNVVKCKNLVFLDLSGIGIKEIPNTISQLKNLEILYLNFSGLEKIPESLYQCTKLRELFFYESNISFLPDGISKLTQLKILHLGRTKICTLPRDLAQCHWLENVIVSNIADDNCISDSLKIGLKQSLMNTQLDWR